MKKVLGILLALCILMTLMCCLQPAALAAGNAGAWEYTLADGRVILTKYLGSASDVFVPGSLKTDTGWLPVAGLGDAVFKGKTNLTSVTIADGVSSIGAEAFSGCMGLLCVLPGKGLTSIGREAFAGCTALNSMIMPDGVTSIGENAFSGCEAVTLYCGKGTPAYKYAFANGVRYRYYNNSTAPRSITENGFTAAVSNGEATLTGIDANMKEVTVPATIGGFPISRLHGAFTGKNVETVALPDSLRVIPEEEFSRCTSLCTISLPNSITEIGPLAFSGCTSLREITIPESVMTIGDSAFSGCTVLEAVQIPDSVTTIGTQAFSRCTALETVTIGTGVTQMRGSVFANCSPKVYIKDIASWCKMQGGLSSVSAENLFIDDISLAELHYTITIPGTVTSIANSAFGLRSDIKSMTIPATVTELGENSLPADAVLYVTDNSAAHTYAKERGLFYVLSGNSPTTTTVDGVTYFISGGEAIATGYTGTETTVTIPETVASATVVGLAGTFAENTTITSVTLPSTLRFIREKSFSGCTALASMDIPNGVKFIGALAFAGCTALKSLTIPPSITEIRDSAFFNCTITDVYVEDLTAWCRIHFRTMYGNPLNNANNLHVENRLVQDLTIPSGVTTICDYAFVGLKGITSVSIPEGVTSLGFMAFYGCTNIKEAIIPRSVEEFGRLGGKDYALFDMNTVWCVYKDSEAHKYAKTKNCLYDLLDDGINYTYVETDIRYFIANGEACALSALVSNLRQYKMQDEIEGYPVTNMIGTFANQTRLEYVCLSINLKGIGAKAFWNCTNLVKIDNFPDKLESIGWSAFFRCGPISRLTLPEGIKEFALEEVQYAKIRTLVLPKSLQHLDCEMHDPQISLFIVYENSHAHQMIAENADRYGFLYHVLPEDGNPEVVYGATFSGTVTDTTGTPVAGAEVRLIRDDGAETELAETNASGEYTFPYVPVGRYTVRVTDSAENTASETLEVKRMNVFDVYFAGETDFVLKAARKVTGTVSPAGVAKVTLCDAMGHVLAETESAQDGSYTFTGIPNGTYILKAETEQGSVTQEITVFNEKVTAEALTLPSATASLSGTVRIADRTEAKSTRSWVQVTLYNMEGNIVAQTKTDETGAYSFSKLPQGAYAIYAETSEMRPDAKGGYKRSHALTGCGYIELTHPEAYTAPEITVREKSKHHAEISGLLQTAEGEPQSGEVFLTDVDGNETVRTKVKADGEYIFRNVDDGVYFIIGTSEKAGMGINVVVVCEGVVSGVKNVTAKRDEDIVTHESNMAAIPDCADKAAALSHKEAIANEKRFYDSLSDKKKKQLSKGYLEKLSHLTSLLAGCDTEGGALSGGGMAVSGDELESGQAIEFILTVEEASKTNVGSDGITDNVQYEQKAIEDAAGDRNLVKYYNISLSKSNGDSAKPIESIKRDTDTTGKLRITLPIPDDCKGHKHYAFVHVHNGKAQMLVDLDDDPNTVTFEVDKFSTFALCYTDEVLTGEVEPVTANSLAIGNNGKLTVSAAEAGRLCIATYNSTKELIDVVFYEIKADSVTDYDFAENQAAFLWDANNRPLTDKFTIKK